MKNRFRILLGISMLAGLTGSTIMHRKQKKWTTSPLDSHLFFLGSWRKSESPSSDSAFLTFNRTGSVTLNKKLLKGNIIQLNEQQLIFEDSYGYQLILNKLGENKLNLYDDAEDKEYILERIS
ncbi:DUF4828 domain-containing protein [Carnobacterium gallinarum]|uniref:DUF4828 domain-containing protein n=1 Tax=Carnobacterium gallinarum TaxID=2749 RepID=UPI00054DF23A|nr:DUF4828 domain-containing protein [Carnobacterium gallinarum]